MFANALTSLSRLISFEISANLLFGETVLVEPYVWYVECWATYSKFAPGLIATVFEDLNHPYLTCAKRLIFLNVRIIYSRIFQPKRRKLTLTVSPNINTRHQPNSSRIVS